MRIFWRNFIDSLILEVVPMNTKFFFVNIIDLQVDLFDNVRATTIWYQTRRQIDSLTSCPSLWQHFFNIHPKYTYNE